MSLTENALRVLRARYLRRNDAGEVVELPEELFRRVAGAVAEGERPFGGDAAVGEWGERFQSAMEAGEFLPNSPTLMNAGTPLAQLSACFVLPVEDSIDGIFDSLRVMALVQQSGGGTGFDFSHLRPRGAVVRSTGGTASGPVSFMKVFDCATDHIRQGGRRRGANMAVLRVDHPDIREFVDAKRDPAVLRNFNLSVGATDAFFEAVARGESVPLRAPSTGDVVGRLPAEELLAAIVDAAWATGDPGMLFLDTINRANPLPAEGAIEAANPCGEVPLLPYEACNLGSVNIGIMVIDSDRDGGAAPGIDWERLRRTVRLGTRFLDDVIEVGRWPDPRIAARVKASRKIGLGVMGFAELLIRLGVSYDSDRALEVADEVMRCVRDEADAASEALAGERGVFPAWDRSVHARTGRRFRNATRTSIAPTGTISLIAGTSSGIEPLFALAYRRRHALGGEPMVEVNPLVLRAAESAGLDAARIRDHIGRHGTLSGLSGVPEGFAALFTTALAIDPRAHLAVQEAFQRHVDNAVSKTINLPQSSTPDEIAAIYREAWQRGLKGTTVYRYGSREEQVLELGTDESPEQRESFATCDPHACRL